MSGAARDHGFSLTEVLIAIVLLTGGTLVLASSVAMSARHLTGSQDQLIATQRAAEAAESVFKARDSGVLAWAQIRNVAGASGTDGGVFLDGPRQLREVGLDGLVNTADDAGLLHVIKPGLDGLLGTPDDEQVPYVGLTREIEVRDLSPTLRRLRVIVTYRTPQGSMQYVLTTYLSAYA